MEILWGVSVWLEVFTGCTVSLVFSVVVQSLALAIKDREMAINEEWTTQ